MAKLDFSPNRRYFESNLKEYGFGGVFEKFNQKLGLTHYALLGGPSLDTFLFSPLSVVGTAGKFNGAK